MIDEQLQWLEREKIIDSQLRARLHKTKIAADMYREAKKNGFSSEFIEELFKLLSAMAVFEWGEGTIVDDFSEPGWFIIRHGKREETI